MHVQHVATAVGHKCTATKTVVLHNEKRGKCRVSVDGGVLVCCVNKPGERTQLHKRPNQSDITSKQHDLAGQQVVSFLPKSDCRAWANKKHTTRDSPKAR